MSGEFVISQIIQIVMILAGLYIGFKKISKGDNDKEVAHAEEHATLREQVRQIHKEQEEQKNINKEIDRKLTYILRLIKTIIKKKEKINV